MGDVPELIMLDVGHGNCTLVLGCDSVAIVDTGRSRTLVEFLQSRRVEKIDLILISHADADHLGGLVGVLSSGVQVDRVVLNADALKDTELWEDITEMLDNLHELHDLSFEVGLHRGHEFVFSGYALEIDAPRTGFAARGVGSRIGGSMTTSNSMSAVVSVLVGGRRRAVLAGDVDWVGLADLMQVVDGDGGLQADLLVYPHHGGSSGGDDAAFADSLMRLVSPSTVGFSIGRVHQTPRPEHVVRAVAQGCRIVCTQLSTRCAGDLPVDEAAHHLLDVVGRGQFSGACCAGSTSQQLWEGGEIVPGRDEHQEFIDRAAATPLCRMTS